MRKAGGASTLTQQLARKLFLTDEKTWERKVKELLLAVQIEKRYTKQEIFTLYCNQMYFGHGAYGVEAAAQLYFGKSVKDLTVEESAMIAGILQGNARQSPYVNPAAALRRRNYALDRMADEGFLTADAAAEAKARPIVTRGDPARENTFAPYYLEEVRKYLESHYGAQQLYESGLTVRTPLDNRLQRITTRALDRRPAPGRQAAHRLPPRAAQRQPSDAPLGAFRHERWQRAMVPGDIVPALVERVDPAGRPGPRRAAHRDDRAELTRESFQWTRRRDAAQVVSVGDLVDVELLTVDATNGTATVRLEQTPLLEGAVVAHREPERPRAGDGRRLQLRPQQVQPRDPGAPADRLDLQADPLYRRHRSRADPGDDARRRSRPRSTPAPASRPIRRATTTGSSTARSPCAPPSSARATSRRSR